MGSSASKLRVRRAQRGKIAELKRMRSAPASSAPRSCSFHPLHRDRADAGLDQALRAVPVADNTLAPVRQA